MESLMANSPSRKDGISSEEESGWRLKSALFLQDAGIRLRFPLLSRATAIVIFQRFFARQSFRAYDRFVVASASLFLAGKVEETPKKIRDVILATHDLRFPDGPPLEVESAAFTDERDRVLVMERLLLHTLAFDLTMEHPFAYLLAFVKELGGGNAVAQTAWNLANDSLQTLLCLQYPPALVAAAAVLLAAKMVNFELKEPEGLAGDQAAASGTAGLAATSWWAMYKSRKRDLELIGNQILDSYKGRTPPELPGNMKLEDLRAHHPAPTPVAAGSSPAPVASSTAAQQHPPPPSEGAPPLPTQSDSSAAHAGSNGTGGQPPQGGSGSGENGHDRSGSSSRGGGSGGSGRSGSGSGGDRHRGDHRRGHHRDHRDRHRDHRDGRSHRDHHRDHRDRDRDREHRRRSGGGGGGSSSSGPMRHSDEERRRQRYQPY